MLNNLRQSIKSRRKELGYSLRKTAELSDSTPNQIKNFEDGKANITVKLLEKICNTLNLHLELK